MSGTKSEMRLVHMIPRGDTAVVYSPESMAISQVNGIVAEAISRMKKGEGRETIAAELGLDAEDLGKIEALARDIAEKDRENAVAVTDEERAPTVYLNLANACNLRCAYCYANFGSYQSESGYMAEETALTALERFFEKFGRIGTITMFGGEPLLRAGLIPAICEKAAALAKDRGVEPPRFAMVTNGTLLDAERVAMIVKYRIGLTVSVDGPAEVHDLLRPDAKGRGSYGAVESGLKALLDAGIRPNIEATYTARHMDAGITPRDLTAFFRDRFGSRTLLIGPVASTPGRELSLSRYYESFIPMFREASRYSLETILTDRPILLFHPNQILQSVIWKRKKPSNQFCYAKLGADHFTVSVNGNVYPCHMMNERAEFEMGDVKDRDFGSTPRFREVADRLAAVDKDAMQCRNCWARHLCFMCQAGVEIETGALYPIPKHRCDLIRGVAEEVLSFVADRMSSKELWQEFVAAYNRALSA